MELNGKVAVITGAASGIGRELALACARKGARVVLADIDERGMAETVSQMETSLAHGGEPGRGSLVVTCDVSRPDQLENLAAKTYDRFGAAHVVFNNAGVAVCGPAWTATLEDWKWALDINLMGVVHGIRAFVPRMLEQKQEAHIVNTASVAGFLSLPGSAVYCVSKHAVVTLSECLLHDLRVAGARIGVSVLAPAFVNTGIAHSERNRPKELAATNPMSAPYEDAMRKAVAAGRLTASQVADITLEAVQANRFYVLPHPKIKAAIEMRMGDILAERTPTDVSRPLEVQAP
ncbi:MAG: SDR family NAD(P)-dependent oxidoreductase [Pseudomonadota bacterium]|nr:SDR family NAD(P)-dependent oxidoreductase [Pseudomonadota bacterium]